MRITYVPSESYALQPTDCLISHMVDHVFSPIFKKFGMDISNNIDQYLEQGLITSEKGAISLISPFSALPIKALITLSHIGPFIRSAYIKDLSKVLKTAWRFMPQRMVIDLVSLAPEEEHAFALEQIIFAIRAHNYQFLDYMSDPEKTKPSPLKEVIILAPAMYRDSAAEVIERTAIICDGQDLARDLGNHPGNVCTPSYLAEQAKIMARDCQHLSVHIYEEAQMYEWGMHSFLSVSAGSAEPAKLIEIQYTPPGTENMAPLVLVGKGVTFDSGGISIKPANGMEEMKYDMCGAASVMGTMLAVSHLGLPKRIIGLIGATENMSGDRATRPGDIVRTMSGQTVEIINTDAEGRLVLCDVLHYAERFAPAAVVDIATLTGACVVALGQHVAGLFGNDEELVAALHQAGDEMHDRAWPMPLWEEYQEQLKSTFADMKNCGSRYAGAITAACFLSRFTKAYRWAHLDIAGVAWTTGDKTAGTGRPVALLTHWLSEYDPVS